MNCAELLEKVNKAQPLEVLKRIEALEKRLDGHLRKHKQKCQKK